MPTLQPGSAHRQREPDLLVENRLEPGRWRFRLVVVAENGLESAPAELVVTVQDDAGPRPGRRRRPQ